MPDSSELQENTSEPEAHALTCPRCQSPGTLYPAGMDVPEWIGYACGSFGVEGSFKESQAMAGPEHPDPCALIADLRRQLADAQTDASKSLFHSLQETRRRLAETRDALRDTNEQIIGYGTNPDEYNWADMLKQTRANDALLREATP